MAIARATAKFVGGAPSDYMAWPVEEEPVAESIDDLANLIRGISKGKK